MWINFLSKIYLYQNLSVASCRCAYRRTRTEANTEIYRHFLANFLFFSQIFCLYNFSFVDCYNMKKYSLIFGAVAVAGILYFVSRASSAKKLKVYFKSIKVDKLKGFALPDIFAQFRIVNPTNTALSVDSIAGDLIVNGKLFTSLQQLEKISIPARSETIASIKVVTPGLSAITAVVNFIRNKKKLNLTFDGTVNTSGFSIPIHETVIQL